MKVYYLGRNADGHPWATVEDHGGARPLDPAWHLWRYGKGGIEWGTHCTGAQQLALALLADATRSPDIAFCLTDRLTADVVAKLRWEGVQLEEERVVRWVLSCFAEKLALPLSVSVVNGWEDECHAN